MTYACKFSIVLVNKFQVRIAHFDITKLFKQGTTADGSEEPASGGTVVSAEKVKEYEETIAGLRQKHEKAQEDATKLQ